MDGATSGDFNALLILAVLLGGFIVVTIMMELVGKNFHWHEELD